MSEPHRPDKRVVGTALLSGNLPSGPDFSMSISLDVIAVRAAETVHLAAPRSMTREQARRVADALLVVALDGEG